MEAIREVVNKQIEIIKIDADASAKIARTDLGRYFDRFADKLDKTQTNAEVDELQNVTIPAIEAIVPQKDPNANDTNSGSDNNDATANSNTNATPENTGQPNVTESTDNANADTSSTTTKIIIMIQQQVKQQEHQQTIHQLMMQMINRQLITILV